MSIIWRGSKVSNDERLYAEIKRLNYLLAQARSETSNAIQRAEDIQRDKDAEISSLCDQLSDAKLRVTQLENTNSKRMFDSVMEKLNNVTSKLIDAESELRELRAKVSDMQRFIDTLPDGLRGAWSLYLMMKQDKESDDE
jgi:chromosome segregation ATPase